MGQQLVKILWYIVQDPFNAARFISQQDFTHLWNTLQDIFWVARWSSLLNSFTLSPGFSVEVESGWKRLYHGSAVSHPSHVHSSASVWSSMAVLLWNSFHTLLPFFFFGGPGLSIPDQSWGRDYVGEADSIVSQLSVNHLLYKVQDLLAQQDIPVSEIVFTLFSFFWWTKS